MPEKLLPPRTTRRWVPLAAALLLAAGPAPGQAPPGCCASRYAPAARARADLRALGRDYQRLRRLRCEACGHYHSDLQLVMETLGTRLSGRPAAEVRRVLGPPDVVRAGTLVYYWRGEHDYLRFRSTRAGTVVSSWYYAYE